MKLILTFAGEVVGEIHLEKVFTPGDLVFAVLDEAKYLEVSPLLVACAVSPSRDENEREVNDQKI